MKACSQLLLQVHIFLVGWLNFSAQGSALDPFFCTPSLDALTQSCSCGHQPRADDPAPQVPDISAHCLLDMPAGISNLGRKFQSATPLPQVFPISRNDTAFQTPQIIRPLRIKKQVITKNKNFHFQNCMDSGSFQDLTFLRRKWLKWLQKHLILIAANVFNCTRGPC